MIFLFTLSILIVLVQSASINAIQKAFPFRINYIFLFNQNVFLNGGVYNIGLHQIIFQDSLNNAPNSILVNIVYDYKQTYTNPIVQYSLIPFDIASTGFKLQSRLKNTYYYSFMMGYMAITNGYGISLNIYNLNQLTSQNTASYNSYTKSTIPVPTGSYKSSLFASVVTMNNFQQQDTINAISYAMMNEIRITYQYPITASISQLTLQLYVHQQEQFKNQIESNGFKHYFFETLQYYNISSVNSILIKNSSQTSQVYFIGGITKGKIRKVHKIAVTHIYNYIVPDQYSSEYLKNRDNSLNVIESHVFDEQISNPAYFTGIWMYRTACSGFEYPYLMIQKQKCLTQCPRYYYNDSLGRCKKCLDCVDIINCEYCYETMCETDEYFTFDTQSCIKCQTIHPNCMKCYKNKCTLCEGSDIVLFQGACIECNLGEYYINSTTLACNSCFGENKCKQCLNGSYCTSCTYPYKLSLSNLCSDCENFYVFDQSIQQCILKMISFISQSKRSKQRQNILIIELIFEDKLTLIKLNYVMKWKLDGEYLDNIRIYQQQNDSTIQVQINIQNISQIAILEVQFIFIGTHRVLRKQFQIITIPQKQGQGQKSVMQNLIIAVSENSGFILSTLSVTSLSGYVVGILWSFQISSYYLFLEVKKPDKLVQYLNLTIQMQNIQLLPFSIPFQYFQQIQIQSKEKYKLYNIQTHFLKANIQDIVSLLLFSLFYGFLCLIFSRIKSNNIVVKFIKGKLVDRVYQNISMNFYSIITVIAFIASAALSSYQPSRGIQFKNHLFSLIGLVLALLFTVLHPVILFRHKEQQSWQTQDCYVGFKREKKHSELMLTILLMSQLIIPISIPLFSSKISLSLIIVSSVVNFILLFKFKVTKFGICIYYRMLSQFCFILFNLLLGVCLILEEYYPEVELIGLDWLGYLLMITLTIVIFLEFVQLITQIIMDVIRFVRKLFLKVKIQELWKSDINPKQKQNTEEHINQFKIKINDNSHINPSKILKSVRNKENQHKTSNKSLAVNIQPETQISLIKKISNMQSLQPKKELHKNRYKFVSQIQLLPSRRTQKVFKNSQVQIEPICLDKIDQRKNHRKAMCTFEEQSDI